MAQRIEDYALIGDTHTGALVGRDGSIDWLCLPRFDSAACFASLLGEVDNGRWLVAPEEAPTRSTRRYRGETLVLETEHVTPSGTVKTIDCMMPRRGAARVIRIVQGVQGRVRMHTDLRVRFDYGSSVPWIRESRGGVTAIAGPDAIEVRTEVPLKIHDGVVSGSFNVREGQRVPLVLNWYPSHQAAPSTIDPLKEMREAERFWRDWARRCTYQGEWREAVVRSLLTLKAMTYRPTGGIVAAVTTSLPEAIGGVRNWDYRFCWLRDATFTLYSLLQAGYEAEARAWRDWLLRAVAGRPSELQIMYGLGGERRLPELELPWLPGYEDSSPVRVGNEASQQFQLDVYGEVLDLLHQASREGFPHEAAVWTAEREILDFLEGAWREPDEGIWEVRGPRRNFTHSKVMAWVAVDRAIRDVEFFGFEGPIDRWRALRKEIHDEVCRVGFDPEVGSFVQFYGTKRLDASLLMIPLVGFLAASDPRVKSTVEAIERDLLQKGFVARYHNDREVEGIPGHESAFLPCTCWLADCLALIGRPEDARLLFERVLSVRNDVGLLSEEYDVDRGRMVGNFPQAFSHVSLIGTARNLSRGVVGPAERRRRIGGLRSRIVAPVRGSLEAARWNLRSRPRS